MTHSTRLDMYWIECTHPLLDTPWLGINTNDGRTAVCAFSELVEEDFPRVLHVGRLPDFPGQCPPGGLYDPHVLYLVGPTGKRRRGDRVLRLYHRLQGL